MKAVFDPTLVAKYNVNGPRYTSYPTANLFTEADYRGVYGVALGSVPRTKPLSLYVHVSFCATVCYYCACNKINTANRKHAALYIEHLAREMAIQARYLEGRHRVEQLHFDGGTPTFLDDAQFEQVFSHLAEHFELIDDPVRDYSIEVDPRGISDERVVHLARLGFNRMSVGVQDFDPVVQEAVNRTQSEADHVAPAIAALSDDGLLEVSRDRIAVTRTGRFLIRNICMAFDAYLPTVATGFSKAD